MEEALKFAERVLGVYDRLLSGPVFEDKRFTPEYKNRYYVYEPMAFYLYYAKVFYATKQFGEVQQFLN